MTKRWIMDARARRSKVYRETHTCLVNDVHGISYTPPDRFKPDDYFPARAWWTYDTEPAHAAQ